MHFQRTSRSIGGLGSFSLAAYNIPSDAVVSAPAVGDSAGGCQAMGLLILNKYGPAGNYRSDTYYSPSSKQYFCGPIVDAMGNPVSQAVINAADNASTVAASGGSSTPDIMPVSVPGTPGTVALPTPTPNPLVFGLAGGGSTVVVIAGISLLVWVLAMK